MTETFYIVNKLLNLLVKKMKTFKELENDLFYMKMFDRQLIFSFDESALKANFLKRIMKDGSLIRYFPQMRTYLVSIPPTHPDYDITKFELMKDKIPYQEENGIIQIKLMPIQFTDQKFIERTKNSLIFPDIKEVLFYPEMVYYKKRFYALLHFKNSSSIEVSRRIIDLHNAYDDLMGPGIFSLEEIGDVKPITEFFRKYGVDLKNLFYMETRVNYSGTIPEKKEGKNYYVYWPFYDGKEYRILPLELITSLGKKYVPILKDFLNNIIARGLVPLYFEGSQFENFRLYKLITFNENLSFIIDLYNSLIDLGLDIEIVRFEAYED